MLIEYKGKTIVWDDPVPKGEDSHREITAEVIIDLYRSHYDRMAAKVHKPKLTDDQLVEDFMTIYWAWIKK